MQFKMEVLQSVQPIIRVQNATLHLIQFTIRVPLRRGVAARRDHAAINMVVFDLHHIDAIPRLGHVTRPCFALVRVPLAPTRIYPPPLCAVRMNHKASSEFFL